MSSVVPRFTLALTKASIDAAELSAIMARRMRPERRIKVFRVPAARFGVVGAAIDHFDRTGDEDFAGVARLEKRVGYPKWYFRLINLNDPFERFAIRVDHRSPQLLCQQPGGLVGEAELIFELPRRHAVGMGRHQMCGPEPRRQ